MTPKLLKTIRANVLGASHELDGELTEKVMTKKDIKKRDEIADAISTKDMKDRYGDKNVKYAIATKIVMDKKKKKKKDMSEQLGGVGRKEAPLPPSKISQKRTQATEKEVNKNEKKSKEEMNKVVMASYDMKQGVTESDLIIQDWNKDDIKFTEIETVDIIKPKPLKEEHSSWKDEFIELDEKFSFLKNLGKIKLNKQVLKGTRPTKLKGVVKVPKDFTKLGAITPFRKSPVTSIKPILSNPFQTPLTKLKMKDALKSTTDKLQKKYGKVVKDPNFKSKVKKKYVTKPQLGGGKPVSKDGMIMPKPGEAAKTDKLIDKYKSKGDKLKNKLKDIDSEKKILDARTNKKAMKDAGEDQLLDKIFGARSAKKRPSNAPSFDKIKSQIDAKELKKLTPAQQKGYERLQKTVDAGRDGMRLRDKTRIAARQLKDKGKEVKSGIKKGLALSAAGGVGFSVGYDKGKKDVIDDILKDLPSPPVDGDKIKEKTPKPGEIMAKNEKKKKTVMASYDWREELGEDWQKVNRKDKTDGLSKKAVKAYRRENPGSKLKTAVTKDPKKLKKGSKDAKRRLSFCRRMKGMKKRLTSAKTARDPDSRINKALRRWNC